MKAAIFDMDGTLIDSMGIWGEACIVPLEKYNIAYPENLINIVTPLGLPGTKEYYKTLGLDISDEEFYDLILRKIEAEYRDNISAKPYVMEYLEKLRTEGVKMCILTASARSYAVPCLERLGIMDYFEFFMSCDEAGMAKTDPGIFKKAADMLGEKIEDTAVFDDNLGALASAKQSGAYVYGVYDQTSEEQAEEIKKNCHKYIKSFKDLL